MVAALDFNIPSNGKKLALYDGEGDECGFVYSDAPSEKLGPEQALEIILLSHYNISVRDLGMTYMDKKNKSGSMDDQEDMVKSRKKRKFDDGKLNVMLIGLSEGIAERLGIGEIWTESVNYLKEPGLRWKEIVLG